MSEITYEQLRGQRIRVLSYYDILQNEDNEILIILPVDMAFEPDEPVFYYDGRKHGILVGGRMPVIICDHIHVDIRKVVERQKDLLFYVTQTASGSGPDGDAAPPVEFLAPVCWQSGVQELAERLIADVGSGE